MKNRSEWTGRVTSLVALLAISTSIPLAGQTYHPPEDVKKEAPAAQDGAAKNGAAKDGAARTEAPRPAVTAGDIKSAIDRGANWLVDHQNPDGSFGLVLPEGKFISDAGVTALALHALATCPRKYREEDGPFISKAVEYILSQKREGGGIYEEGQGLRNYKSSMALLAFAALDEGRPVKKYADVVTELRDYIASLQLSEDSSPAYDPEGNRRAYGGIGYGGDRRPDVSNTQMALEALQAGDLAEDSEVFRRVQTFLARCQNRTASNDFLDGSEHRSTEDGGFFYYPGESKAENHKNPDGSVSYTSYGSMTYAAVKSLIYSGLDKDDARVKAAVDWIRHNFTVKENPGMATPESPARGQMGVFYYYAVMARTLEVLGEPTFVDGAGISHAWAAELAAELLSRQRPDGTWTNPVDRWWEGDPALVTAYAVQTLSICVRNLKKE